jgi:predicted TIM-barrel enzyme
VRAAVSVPVYVASGALPELLPSLAEVSDGVIVGSALRANGRAGGRVDPAQAASFGRAFREAYSVR